MSSEKIYVASSWKNTYQPEIVNLLLKEGFAVYDFRNPQRGGPAESQGYRVPAEGFSWRQTDPDWGRVTPDIIDRYKRMLRHETAQAGFAADFNAMKWADTCLLVLPSGRSAHLEAGWMAGSGRRLVVYMPPATTVCQDCKGEGTTVTGFYAPITGICKTCNGEGEKLLWSFEPELMYMIGGDVDLITTSYDDMLGRLRRPFPDRQAIVWNAETGGQYIIHTDRPYPMPNEMMRDPEPT